MRTIRALYKAFGLSLEMPKPDSAGKARTYSVFGIIVFALIMVPSSILVGYITYLLSNLLMFFGNKDYALVSLTHIINSFEMIFTMPVIFNVMYFARDLSFLRAMPVTPVQLFSSKFWHTYRAENVMTAGVLLAMFIGWATALYENFGASYLFDPVGMISFIAGLFLIPMLPMIYCAILCMVLMVILRKVRKISIFYHSSTLMFIIFAFIFLMSFRGEGGMNIERYVDMLVAGTNSFNDLCDVLFMTTPMIIDSMSSHKILPLILAVLITAAFYGFMILICRLCYNDGLYTAACLGAGRNAAKTSGFTARTSSPFAAFFRKEMRVLMRTMSYRTNCVYANLIWPVLSIVFFALSRNNVNILRFISLYRGGQAQSRVLIVIVVCAMSFIAAGLNSIASTSFTREGAHIDMIRYLPIPLDRIVYAKSLTAILFSYIPLAISVIFASYSLGAEFMTSLYYLFISLLSVIVATIIGVCMDSISPYTVWSDESVALRGNMNCFFNLAAGMLLAALICGGIYLLYMWKGSTVLCGSVLSLVLVLMTVSGWYAGMRFVKKRLTE
ncbi:MAG: hypothetical protein IKE53_08210 [Clostridiales bacterium]|nr:hypothetical protein [Clostridiales bacterium]